MCLAKIKRHIDFQVKSCKGTKHGCFLLEQGLLNIKKGITIVNLMCLANIRRHGKGNEIHTKVKIKHQNNINWRRVVKY